MSPHASPCPSLPLFVRILDNQGTVEAGILFYLTRMGWDADERPVTASMESGGGQWPWLTNRCSYRHHDLSKLFANMSSISKQCWQKPSALAWKELGTSASSILL